MTRLARNRDTHLTREEIAAEALRQFDAGATAPSIRQLATALDVAPSAIYHHFRSRAAIYQAAVDLVWGEATADVLDLVPDPWAADPRETLIAAGIASRRAFMRHYRIAPYASATPAGEGMMANVIALVASLLERIGLSGEQAAGAFHTYATFTFGTIIFAATRQIAHDELGGGAGDGRFSSAPGEREASFSQERTRVAIDGVIDLTAIDPERDEQLFAGGLERLVDSFVQEAGR
jgi:AcrR family transcriptional regulator